MLKLRFPSYRLSMFDVHDTGYAYDYVFLTEAAAREEVKAMEARRALAYVNKKFASVWVNFDEAVAARLEPNKRKRQVSARYRLFVDDKVIKTNSKTDFFSAAEKKDSWVFLTKDAVCALGAVVKTVATNWKDPKSGVTSAQHTQAVWDNPSAFVEQETKLTPLRFEIKLVPPDAQVTWTA